MPKIEKSQAEKAIFATIAYYDYFNYPLTAGEVYCYLMKLEDSIKNDRVAPDQELKFSEIIEILDNSEKLGKLIEQKNGLYFLRGREGMIKQRIQKKKLMDQKFKKIKWILGAASYFPFVRLIMLSGSMGLGNPLKESDVDLLVVAKHGRIWTARAILTFFALMFGAYRHTGRTKNRLCLNHYITDQSLGIDFGNPYKAEEYLNLLPLAGDFDIYDDFFRKNSWMKDYTHSVSGSLGKNLRLMGEKRIYEKIKYFFEFLLSGYAGDSFERCMRKFQIYFIEKNPLTKSPHARIRYNDDNLVFHPVLVEPEVVGQWKEKIARFNA